VIAALATTALLAVLFTKIEWVDAFRPLPLVALAIVASSCSRYDARSTRRMVLRASFGLFALVMLSASLLSARVQFYGFALAAPALVLFVLALVDWIPSSIGARGGSAATFRACALPLLAAIALGHLLPMRAGLADKRILVGSGADAFLADPRGEFVQRALEVLERREPKDGTLLVVPEGAMLNYLARRRSPTRYFNYMPPELLDVRRGRDRARARGRAGRALASRAQGHERVRPAAVRPRLRARHHDWIRAHYTPVRLWSVDPGSKPLEPGTRYAWPCSSAKR
jgi:hypothetical protein